MNKHPQKTKNIKKWIDPSAAVLYYSPPGNNATAGWSDKPERADGRKVKATKSEVGGLPLVVWHEQAP